MGIAALSLVDPNRDHGGPVAHGPVDCVLLVSAVVLSAVLIAMAIAQALPPESDAEKHLKRISRFRINEVGRGSKRMPAGDRPSAPGSLSAQRYQAGWSISF